MTLTHLIKHWKCWRLYKKGWMPKWRDDRVAKMLGVAAYGCPLCGYGATKEKERYEQSEEA